MKTRELIARLLYEQNTPEDPDWDWLEKDEPGSHELWLKDADAVIELVEAQGGTVSG